MLLENIHKEKVASCNNFNQFSCKNQFSDEYKQQILKQILKVVEENGSMFRRFKLLYDSCLAYNGKTKIKISKF